VEVTGEAEGSYRETKWCEGIVGEGGICEGLTKSNEFQAGGDTCQTRSGAVGK